MATNLRVNPPADAPIVGGGEIAAARPARQSFSRALTDDSHHQVLLSQ
jgi:hypothetical protein